MIGKLQKRCSTCNLVKSVSRFTKNSRCKDGYLNFCNDCRKLRRNSKKEVGKRVIRRLVVNEVMHTPKPENKGIWDGLGVWCQKYPEIDRCVECNSTVYKHHARGVCRRCYRKFQSQRFQSKIINWNKENRKKIDEKAKNERRLQRKILGKIESGQIKKTPKINNLIKNLNE